MPLVTPNSDPAKSWCTDARPSYCNHSYLSESVKTLALDEMTEPPILSAILNTSFSKLNKNAYPPGTDFYL